MCLVFCILQAIDPIFTPQAAMSGFACCRWCHRQEMWEHTDSPNPHACMICSTLAARAGACELHRSSGVYLLREVLKGIRIVKCYAWENAMEDSLKAMSPLCSHGSTRFSPVMHATKRDTSEDLLETAGPDSCRYGLGGRGAPPDPLLWPQLLNT